VSPAKGALFMITRFWILTVVVRKVLNKLKSAAKLTLASTLSFITCVIFSFIYLEKIGIANKEATR
jgi:hypothetical protein